MSPTRATLRLNSSTGEHSGLNLVCILNVGMKHVAPEQDIVMDPGREYEAASAFVVDMGSS